ncbi:hypothetical protein H8L32_20890 [Undibacterium sp. CY18W]|uniref:Uncharacterized protein n=1 Tax=Undibacterium hunanense TaxID=2762292 RepID=A0ABR6ZVN1_9BURK|nr:hypothetical protein [Undibacterium hunanense]MBC3919940.1 hypothetical protein [Undibacterium hunanense]
MLEETMFENLDHLYRFPTRAAIDALAIRFNLPNTKDMQDWEYEVADANRIAEFLAAYDSGELSEDEKFTLVAILFESFWDALDEGRSFLNSASWKHFLDLLEQDIQIHIYLVWYWSSVNKPEADIDNPDYMFSISPLIRPLLLQHQGKFARH